MQLASLGMTRDGLGRAIPPKQSFGRAPAVGQFESAFPQGLKPAINFGSFTARLKSCPFKTGLKLTHYRCQWSVTW